MRIHARSKLVILGLLVAVAVTGAGAVAGAGPGASDAKLVAGAAGAALERARLTTAFAIVNDGDTSAAGVSVTSIVIDGGTLVSPSQLPVALGTIPTKGARTVYATFAGHSFTAGTAYVMKIAGRFAGGDFAVEQRVRVPAASPGSAKATSSSSRPHVVKGPRFPHVEPDVSANLNESHAPPVPVGVFHAPKPPSPQTSVQPAKADPPPINFFHNASLAVDAYALAEPSGDVANNVVFATMNTTAAFSVDGGAHFTKVDPTTLFANSDGGLCCDQIVRYVAGIDRFVWVLQYIPVKTAQGTFANRYRLAAASPAAMQSSGATSWTTWDLTSAQLGDAKGALDFPDLAVGDHSLYLSFNQSGGRVVTRIPLSQIQSGAPLSVQSTKPADGPMALFAHPTQNARDEVFWAGHTTNSSMRVFNWPEASGSYAWLDVSVGSWPNDNSHMTSLTPDNQNWVSALRFDSNYVSGAARLVSAGKQPVNQVWLAWTAPSGGHFGQPHVEWVALDRSNNLKLVAQHQIWNNAYAFAYPELAVNANGTVGLSLAYGGNGHYENHVAGFWGDYIVYVTTSSSTGTTRYGDYVTIRQDATHPNRFDAFGYGLSSGPKSDTHYVQFGRPGS